ncbi:MAG: aspartate aminotransferase family protein [Gemmatimonadota bacterium]|nr:aspartate aminotransferase family protein [Gemmatimonadota bacterium]
MTNASAGNLPPRVTGPIPGRLSAALTRRLTRVESRNITFSSPEFPIFWRKARGSNVWDPDGNRYVDLTAGFGVAAAGHGNRRVTAAIRSQLTRLTHGLGDVHPPTAKLRLLEALANRSPVPDPRIVLTNSGSEAVEVALKTARLATGRPGVLCFTGAYHGLTYGALALTDRAHFRLPFQDQLNPHIVRVPFPTGSVRDELAVLEAALDADRGPGVGAVILEPIQGRGGIIEPPGGFLPGLAALCRRRGILLVLDEVYTGCGRTGAWFACQHEKVVPDLVCVGKALSGSLPIAACLGSSSVMLAWPESTGEAIHTSTFLGNPLACAAATASLHEIGRRNLPERAASLGARWMQDLSAVGERHSEVREVRGQGLLVGVELIDPETGAPATKLAGRIVREALGRGWILLADGPSANVIALTPPLTISRELLVRATEMLDDLLSGAGRVG